MFFGDLAYFVQEGIRSVRQNRLMSVVTIITIAFALLIFGAFLVVYSNLRLITNNWVQEVEITAYLKKDFSPARVDQIKKTLWENREIARIEYVSEQEALQRFKVDQADSIYLLEGLNGNPLPASFEISLSKAAQNREAVDALVERIRGIPEFEEIQYGQDWTRSLLTFLKILRMIGFIMGGLLAVAIIFIIANTVRLTVYARRDELSVMRLMGATNWFIKGPFLMEGFFQGLIGASLSLVSLYGLFHFWVPRVRQSAGIFFLQDISISFLSVSLLVSIIVAGMLLGLFGSLMSLGRHLKV
jgi:cell division transport system permease protein